MIAVPTAFLRIFGAFSLFCFAIIQMFTCYKDNDFYLTISKQICFL